MKQDYQLLAELAQENENVDFDISEVKNTLIAQACIGDASCSVAYVLLENGDVRIFAPFDKGAFLTLPFSKEEAKILLSFNQH